MGSHSRLLALILLWLAIASFCVPAISQDFRGSIPRLIF